MYGLLFRLPSIVYFIVAPIALALGIWGYTSILQDDAERARALAKAPPAAVAIEKYDPAKNKGEYNEAVILAQLDVAKIIDVVKKKGSRETGRVVVAPLYATDAKERTPVVPLVLVTDETLTDTQISAMAVGQGAFGPILKIDGLAQVDSGLSSDAQQALASVTTSWDKTVFIQPFGAGRAAALSKKGASGVVLGLGILAAVILVIIGLFRRRSEASRRAY